MKDSSSLIPHPSSLTRDPLAFRPRLATGLAVRVMKPIRSSKVRSAGTVARGTARGRKKAHARTPRRKGCFLAPGRPGVSLVVAGLTGFHLLDEGPELRLAADGLQVGVGLQRHGVLVILVRGGPQRLQGLLD